MAAKHYHIATPEQLQSLVPLAKNNAPTVARVARIWKAAREKKGETRWDQEVYAGFSGDQQRTALIFRFEANGSFLEVAALHYNKALRWCEQNLRQVYD